MLLEFMTYIKGNRFTGRTPRLIRMFRPVVPLVLSRRTGMVAATIPKIQKAILINETGSYDVLKYQDYPVPSITNNEVLVKNRYAGVNFIEAYFRKGLYPSEKPLILGREASGIVVAKGNSVKNFEVGDKVAYLSAYAFAQYTSVDASGRIVKLPGGSDDGTLRLYAASLLQSLTALTFIDEAHNVKKGEFILNYAAAGGVGLILNQLLKERGAHIIAVVSTEEKLELAKQHGAEYGIIYSKEDIPSRVKEITKDQGVDAAFDSIGKVTFDSTIASLKRKGTFVSYGNASGPVAPFPLLKLAGNTKLVRPSVANYLVTNEEWRRYSQQLVSLLGSGKLKFNIYHVFPLGEYPKAAQLLEERKTTGKLVLEIPQ